MLRVRTLYACSAGETARYYTRYLDEPDEEPGRWRGRQATALGLDGAVDTDQLETLLSGHDPTSGYQLGSALADRFKADGTVIKAVAGYDATFSAPKSLSVWWALTGDPGLLEAHDVAVAAVLDHLEARGATTRIRRNNARAFVDTNGLMMAAFRQSTSREDDPQIHTHVVISTKVRATDGRWYALDARYLKRKQRALGGIYQSVLRAELAHRYGVEWGPITEGQAELAAMPDELIETFSKRARQVEDYLEIKLMGFRETEGRDPTRWERAAIAREAAADSRRDKTGAPVPDLRRAWRDEAAELGWSGARLTKTLAAAHPSTARSAPVSVDQIIDQLSVASSAWLPIDVMRILCDTLPASGTHTGAEWLALLNRAVDQVAERNTVLDPSIDGAKRVSDGRSVWVEPIKAHLTDQAILEQEERILAFAHQTQNEKPSESRSVVTKELDPLQADAARAVAGTDKLVMVVGPAGTGKTTALARAVDDLRTQQRPVIGLAPTAKAARVLGDGAGVRAETVAKLLHDWQRPTGPTGPYRLAPDTTVIVDESGMVGTSSLDALVTLAEQNQWRLVLVGDPRQLHAVGRSGLFDELCRTHPVRQLATIHRFSERWEQIASLSLRTGTTTAIDAYLGHDRVQAGSFLSLQVDIARRWIDAHEAGQTVTVVAETNAHVDSLNLAIQAARLDLHQLGRSRASIGGHEQAYNGDYVVTRRNDRTLRTDQDQPIRNRDRWTVQAIDQDGSLTVTHHGGEGTVTLPVVYASEHVRLGYAATAHGNQGDTVDIGLAVVTPATSHRSLYVGATRGRDENRLLVVADDLDQAREVLEQVINNERADVPAVVRRRELLEQADSRPSDTSRATRVGPKPRPQARPTWVTNLEACTEARWEALEQVRPFWDAIEEARQNHANAETELRRLREQHRKAGRFTKSRFREPLARAADTVASASAAFDLAAEQAEPHNAAYEKADRAFTAAKRVADIERVHHQVEEMQRRSPTRDAPGL
jgi:conjugative relaxase-like TrwC/TraI family protein